MPPPTDARHYRWNELPADHPLARLDRRRVVGERVMLAEVVLHEGCHVPTHAHDNEQFACVFRGAVRFGIGPEGDDDRYEVTLGPGEVLHLPPNVPHSADALEDSVVLDVFSPPSDRLGSGRD